MPTDNPFGFEGETLEEWNRLNDEEKAAVVLKIFELDFDRREAEKLAAQGTFPDPNRGLWGDKNPCFLCKKVGWTTLTSSRIPVCKYHMEWLENERQSNAAQQGKRVCYQCGQFTEPDTRCWNCDAKPHP